ncbi:LysM peptidoglycan-binding domain-containing protein [Aureimonas sp. AU40]|uniref:LysM peptidoglycan-binding domain-containing protein n=1 Tax=Aureimonas sp. AU40 TaxID=1637747 RepID=UPI0007847E1E|nr:LysM domain-containing protein [Aureimonas sp. AU40]
MTQTTSNELRYARKHAVLKALREHGLDTDDGSKNDDIANVVVDALFPSAGPITGAEYTIQAGDTLRGIAARLPAGIDWTWLFKRNREVLTKAAKERGFREADWNKIWPGTTIRVTA